MTIICGVDVAVAWLDAAIGGTRLFRRVPRTLAGIAELAAFCREQQVELVVMEASGGYERLPFALLWEAGLPCALANPRQVRRFAEGMGRLEKTDRLDAAMIADFAAVRGLAPQQLATAGQARLVALTGRLRQVTDTRVALRNQRRLVTDAIVLASIEEALVFDDRQIATLEQAIEETMSGDPLWTALSQAFRVIRGVADRTVSTLLALLPEIGTLSNKAAAKLVGLAPIAHDSGQRSGKRPVRSLLVCIATIVARHEPDFIAMRQRMLAAGKAKNLIRVAIARKLLVRLNAKARDVRNAMQPA